MQRLWLTIPTLFLLFASALPTEAARPLWQKIAPKKQLPADPNGDYTLTEENGPWLVLAASFNGEEAEREARDLVLELRRGYGLPAYYYGMTFQMEAANPGRGLDQYGSKIRRRYQRGNHVREHAVLVGEFPSLDDPTAQKLLKRIKQLQPEALATEEGESTSQSLAKIRQLQNYVREKIGNDTQKGPMSHAFLTRNPLLPKEYFVPQGVDDDIAKWNEKLEYSLMKCPGKFSIRVATFRGRSSLRKATDEIKEEGIRKATNDEPLVVAGRNAHLMTVALREKGWEAYEFHDRHESYVAIGSFSKGRTLADGSIVINNDNAMIIANTFGASSPNNTLNRPAPQDQRLEQERKQQFNSLFANGMGQVAEGFHPKRFVGMPLDIYPKPVRVPRRSISSVYARK